MNLCLHENGKNSYEKELERQLKTTSLDENIFQRLKNKLFQTIKDSEYFNF